MNVDLNSLFKFIKPYNGDRQTLNSFLTNCNNVYDLANTEQQPVLFKYILSQLQGKAEIACSVKAFTHWDQLKDFLKTQFSDTKHYSHLLAELQESRQGINESVSQFALRIEECLSQLLTDIVLAKSKETPGRTAAMEDLALHHFLIGLTPRISNIVRCKSPRNLNEAIGFAISEEKIQKLMYKRNIPNPPTSLQRRYPENYRSANVNNVTSQNQFEKICRYCKNKGHVIEECRKRAYNNNRFRQENSQYPNHSRFVNRQQLRVHMMDEEQTFTNENVPDQGQMITNEHLNE